MKVLVPAESRPGENRVALVPESVGRLTALGLTVAVQTGAGLRSYATDDDYRQAGAEVIGTEHVAAALGVTDVVATVRPLHPKAVELLKPGAITVSFLQPVADLATVVAAANAGATALSFDLVPRISRAQSMDALTSQSLVSGYLAALVGATRLPKFFPLFMTAAGTIPPAKVLVLGAGVAGLQAMATARRLGAVVSAYDVRPSSADEVKSMGATFLALDLETAQGAGGYATEMAADRAARQMELLAPYVADSDVVITTAAIPGRPAPRLVSAEMVAAMRTGLGRRRPRRRVRRQRGGLPAGRRGADRWRPRVGRRRRAQPAAGARLEAVLGQRRGPAHADHHRRDRRRGPGR